LLRGTEGVRAEAYKYGQNQPFEQDVMFHVGCSLWNCNLASTPISLCLMLTCRDLFAVVEQSCSSSGSQCSGGNEFMLLVLQKFANNEIHSILFKRLHYGDASGTLDVLLLVTRT